MKKPCCIIASIFIILSLLNGCGTRHNIEAVQNKVSSDSRVTQTIENGNLNGEGNKNTKVVKVNKADDNQFSRNMRLYDPQKY